MRQMLQNIAKMMTPCKSSGGGSVVAVKRLGAIEALKPGETVAPGKAGFKKAKWVVSGMIGDDGALSGFAGALLQLRRHGGSLQL